MNIEKNILNVLQSNRCTGCTACVSACPMNALHVVHDKYGFLKPELDRSICINCGKCSSVCPVMCLPEQIEPCGYFYGWTKKKEVRSQSTSGGMFWELAQNMISQKGTVYGAVLDLESRTVRHMSTKQVPIERMMSSKYVQSDLSNCFEEVEGRLQNGEKVLFVGTPCQIYALKSRKLDKPDNLITVDFICHGVPSPQLFKDYLNVIGKNITAYSFRNKKVRGWSHPFISYKKGHISRFKIKSLDAYSVFFSENGLNPGCTECPFRNTHYSDFTIGDFWGYASHVADKQEIKQGISLCIINNEKGLRYFQEIKNKCELAPLQPKDIAYTYNNVKRRSIQGAIDFYDYYIENGYKNAVKRYANQSILTLIIERIHKKLAP